MQLNPSYIHAFRLAWQLLIHLSICIPSIFIWFERELWMPLKERIQEHWRTLLHNSCKITKLKLFISLNQNMYQSQEPVGTLSRHTTMTFMMPHNSNRNNMLAVRTAIMTSIGGFKGRTSLDKAGNVGNVLRNPLTNFWVNEHLSHF